MTGPVRSNDRANASNDLHIFDDVDSSALAHHHTLGPGANQAARGSEVGLLDKRITTLESLLSVQGVAKHSNEGLDAWVAGKPDLWDAFWTTPTIEWTQDFYEKIAGLSSWKSRCKGTDINNRIGSTVWAVSAGNTETVEFWAKSNSPDARVALDLMWTGDGTDPTYFSGGSTTITPFVITPTTQWRKYSTSIVIPATKNKFRFYANPYAVNNTDCYVWIDETFSSDVAPDIVDTGWVTMTLAAAGGAGTAQYRAVTVKGVTTVGVKFNTTGASLPTGANTNVVTGANGIPAAYRPGQPVYGLANMSGVLLGDCIVGTAGDISFGHSAGATITVCRANFTYIAG